MRKIIAALLGGASAVVAAVTLAAAPSSASDGGVNATQLSEHGWTCLWLVHATHCFPPGIHVSPTDLPPSIPVLVFGAPRTNPLDPNAPFLGTEHNIRFDLFAGQPCPTDPPDFQYTFLPSISRFLPPYWACHRFAAPSPPF